VGTDNIDSGDFGMFQSIGVGVAILQVRHDNEWVVVQNISTEECYVINLSLRFIVFASLTHE
jgi:hypothetical protein